MAEQDLKLMAHLLRRAAFGARRDELERYAAQGYEATVEELLNPGDPGNIPDDVIRRVHTSMDEGAEQGAADWIYRMITTRNPLEEKLTLFWHGLFAVGYAKGNQARSQINEINAFRRNAFGNFGALLVELSRDPAMIFWLDNNENHKGAVNENYGRELLELFAMGIGNYDEDDVKEASRAFTGWTIGNEPYMETKATKDSFSPYGRIAWHYMYDADDHDDGEKTFLGESGRFNGDDIVGIIAKQRSTARFVCTRLFQYFASDKVDEEGERAIDEMVDTYFESGYEIRSVMRTLFNSEYFKSDKARYARVKNPVELVVGTIHMAGTRTVPSLANTAAIDAPKFMGQALLRPPSVEGWHEGDEWIDSGALVERVNFCANEVKDPSSPGIQAIAERLANMNGGSLTPEELVDGCLDLVGPIDVSEETHASIVEFAANGGDVKLRGREPGDEAEQRVGQVLSLIVASPEYQLA